MISPQTRLRNGLKRVSIKAGADVAPPSPDPFPPHTHPFPRHPVVHHAVCRRRTPSTSSLSSSLFFFRTPQLLSLVRPSLGGADGRADGLTDARQRNSGAAALLLRAHLPSRQPLLSLHISSFRASGCCNFAVFVIIFFFFFFFKLVLSPFTWCCSAV